MTGRTRVVVAALLLAAALVGWLALRGRAGDAGGHVPPASSWPRSIVDALSASTAPDPKAASRAPSTPGDSAPEERQICGGTWVKVGADGQIDGEPPDIAPAVAALRERLVATLRGDRDDYSRAVGVWMDDPDGAALVDLALGTNDPRAYGLAFRSCRRQAAVAGSPCGLLGAAQWARLDPGNAAPWLYVLAEAATRKDAAGVDEALFQIGASVRNEMGYFQPVQPLLDAAPADDAALAATFGVVSEAIGRVAATSFVNIAPLHDACRGAVLADANRSQLCGRVADVLADRSDDLIHRHLGARMVAELTGSPDRQQLQNAEMDEWTAAQLGNLEAVDPLGCKAVRSLLDRLREQAIFGESGAIRRWLDRSGLTPKELLARADQRVRRAAAASAAAISAAPAPPRPEPAASSGS